MKSRGRLVQILPEGRPPYPLCVERIQAPRPTMIFNALSDQQIVAFEVSTRLCTGSQIPPT